MKVPLSWLKEYIPVEQTPHQLARILTNGGLEIDAIETVVPDGDVIFDLSLTPNLWHCASITGIARELSALTGTPWKKPEDKSFEESDSVVVRVTVEDSKKCPRYACCLVKGVVIGPSPLWMQKRLKECGFRPVNNVVDITNYVLMELGQPLHAFDWKAIAGGHIVVKGAGEGEKLETLDHKERVLTAHDLLIGDEEKTLALAGIIGGSLSEVSDNTVDILIESAYFLPQTVRRTAKRLGIMTDASKRFEKGCDPNRVVLALQRCVQFLVDIAHGSPCGSIVDVGGKEFPLKSITCRLSRTNALLGTNLGASALEEIFTRLDFSYSWDAFDTFIVEVPAFRYDVSGEVDLIEEVARIHGYDRIPKSEPKAPLVNIPHSPLWRLEEGVRERLLSEGLQEFLTCDLIGPKLLDAVNDTSIAAESIIAVLNPVSVENSVLRTSLLPGLMGVVKYNEDHQQPNISGFEIGRVHFKEQDRYIEQLVAGIVFTGKSALPFVGEASHDVDFYDLKGIIENLLQEYGVKDALFKRQQLPTLHPWRQASILNGELKIGSLGEVHPDLLYRFDIPHRVYFAEINLHDLAKVRSPTKKMKPLPQYPGSERDWTVTVTEEFATGDLLSMVREVPARLLEAVDPVDIYRSDKLGKDKKNVTLRFYYRDLKKTLSQEAVDSEHAQIVDKVTEKLKRE